MIIQISLKYYKNYNKIFVRFLHLFLINVLFYFILFYFILFYFILFYFILHTCILYIQIYFILLLNIHFKVIASFLIFFCRIIKIDIVLKSFLLRNILFN